MIFIYWVSFKDTKLSRHPTAIDIENESEEMKAFLEIERKKKAIPGFFGSKLCIFITFSLSTVYNLTFMILLIVFTERIEDKFKDECSKLINWNRSLYIALAFSIAFSLLLTICQITKKNDDKCVCVLLLIRLLYDFIITVVFAIGITVSYAKVDDLDSCGKVKYVDLVYIILEWLIIGFCLITHCLITIYLLACKAKREFWNGEGEVKYEEIQKVIEINKRLN